MACPDRALLEEARLFCVPGTSAWSSGRDPALRMGAQGREPQAALSVELGTEAGPLDLRSGGLHGPEGDGWVGPRRGLEQTRTCAHSDANLPSPSVEFTPKGSRRAPGGSADTAPARPRGSGGGGASGRILMMTPCGGRRGERGPFLGQGYQGGLRGGGDTWAVWKDRGVSH